ncbi:hypothetical protein PVAND_006307 [Polypedilum vanderplanki]|uniref:Uncharacterized protein n=1 Tax=Polypedilum vanderplanki TaxID=319348 RepID=A0A9J6C2S1_POLVA|nr:hypothetical protein PVAND_006307 [Polypedilum vanderplanki]
MKIIFVLIFLSVSSLIDAKHHQHHCHQYFDCDLGQIWDQESCSCKCISDASSCKNREIFDDYFCTCFCPYSRHHKCSDKKKQWSYINCDCVCKDEKARKACTNGRWSKSQCKCIPNTTTTSITVKLTTTQQINTIQSVTESSTTQSATKISTTQTITDTTATPQITETSTVTQTDATTISSSVSKSIALKSALASYFGQNTGISIWINGQQVPIIGSWVGYLGLIQVNILNTDWPSSFYSNTLNRMQITNSGGAFVTKAADPTATASFICETLTAII